MQSHSAVDDVEMEDFAEDDESEEDYIQDEAIMPASLRPPAHGQAEVPWGGGGFVLLDLTAYMADRRNATTASCEMRDGKGVIHVTFCTASPPLVSYFCDCVHCTGGLKLSEFALEPEIVATEGSLVLLRVALGHVTEYLDPDISEYFVYHALGPSLTQLPHPRPFFLPQHPHVAIVRDCSHCNQDCNYTIASLYRRGGPPGSFYLCLFRSGTMTWSRETIPDKEVPNSCIFTSKTITIGGKRGTVGWVDLLQGIILCDVLADTTQHTLRYVPIPSLLAGRKDLYSVLPCGGHRRRQWLHQLRRAQGPGRAGLVVQVRRLHRRWLGRRQMDHEDHWFLVGSLASGLPA